MDKPTVTWYTQDNTEQVLSHDFEVVDAGTISQPVGFLIWNNRGGNEDVSDMTHCSFETKDRGGGLTGELVENNWIEVHSVQLDELDEDGNPIFFPVGTDESGEALGHMVGAVLGVDDDTGEPMGIIRGGANDGTKQNAPDNFAEVLVRAHIPELASAGAVDFRLRIFYRYV